MLFRSEKIFEGNWLLMAGLLALSFVGVFFLLKYQKYILDALDAAKSKIAGPKVNTDENVIENDIENELENDL